LPLLYIHLHGSGGEVPLVKALRRLGMCEFGNQIAFGFVVEGL